LRVDVSKRFVTFQYLSGGLKRRYNHIQECITKRAFFLPCDLTQKKRAQQKTGFAETEISYLIDHFVKLYLLGPCRISGGELSGYVEL
jgi:hypothetical protein